MLLSGSSSVETGGAGGGTSGGTSGSTAGGSGGSGNAGGSAGVSGSSGAGGSAAAGGSGGVLPCTPLGLTAGPIAFSANNYAHRAPPKLSPVGGTTSKVAVTVAEMPVESPVTGPATLRGTAFPAWEPVWPDSLGEGSIAPFVVGFDQYVIDPSRGDDAIAIAYPASPQPPAAYPNGVLYQPEANLLNGAFGSTRQLVETEAAQHLLRFLRTGTVASLAGVQRTVLDANGEQVHELVICVEPIATSAGSCIPMAACGTDALDADALALEQGFLVAYSSSRGFAECMNDDGITGLPDRIVVAYVGGPGGGYGPLLELDQPDDLVLYVRLIPHSAGAWLVYQYAGLNAEVPPPLMAMRIGEDGSVLLEPTELLDGTLFFGEPAVTAIGDQLMIAWLDAFDPSGDTSIMMRVFDGEGTLLTQSFHPSFWARPRLSALGSPDGQHVLVGWSEQTGMDGAGEEQAYVARFTCGAGQF